MDDHITLDKESFKALAVDTRIDILKTLGSRRHTQSEVASELELSVPTIKEHLDALVKAGLVERHDEGRKWVYYSLTKKGRAILNPEEKKFWIALGVFVLSAASVGTGVVRQQFIELYAPQQKAEMGLAPQMAALASDSAMREAKMATAVEPSTIPWGWIIIGTLLALELLTLSYFWWKARQHRKILLSSAMER